VADNPDTRHGLTLADVEHYLKGMH